jgi:hypothetical protein
MFVSAIRDPLPSKPERTEGKALSQAEERR